MSVRATTCCGASTAPGRSPAASWSSTRTCSRPKTSASFSEQADRTASARLDHAPDCPQPAAEERELVQTGDPDQGDRAAIGELEDGIAVLLLGRRNNRPAEVGLRLRSNGRRAAGAAVFR